MRKAAAVGNGDRPGPVHAVELGGTCPFSHADVKLVASRQVMKAVMATGGQSGSIGVIDYFEFVK